MKRGLQVGRKRLGGKKPLETSQDRREGLRAKVWFHLKGVGGNVVVWQILGKKPAILVRTKLVPGGIAPLR